MSLTDEYRTQKIILAQLANDAGEAMAALAARSLACITLAESGWKEGDPDPTDGGGPGGGEVIQLFYHLKVAA